MAENKTIYQWIKGDRLGDVCVVDNDKKDVKFIYFEDGTRIMKNVVQEFLMKVNSETEILQFTSEQSQESTQSKKQETPVVETKTPEKEVEVSVMGKMIEKMSKKNVVQIPLNININVPTPAIYAMLSEGMEEEDLNDEIIQAAMKQIDINNLQEYVKENVSNFLTDYYSN